jgi:hypothetical protein
MICAEMLMAAAKDGVFPERLSGCPRTGSCPASSLHGTASIAMFVNYTGDGERPRSPPWAHVRDHGRDPHAFSALAQISGA